MSWLYTREAGNDGQVITHEGGPEGEVLARCLHDGPMPIRAGLELIALMADILTIAAEDDAVHGGIKPTCVYLGTAGEVTIDGYGVSRHSVGAPEEQPVGIVSDVYGLGLMLYTVLSSDSTGAAPRERQAHDEAMKKGLSAIDWGPLRDKPWWGAVLQFMCSMVSFDAQGRPEPLDVANLLGEVANQAPGETLQTWAQQGVALNRRPVAPKKGPRSPLRQAARSKAAHAIAEQSGDEGSEPASLSRRKGASTRGQCTGFWTHQKISDLLESDSRPGVQPVRRRRRSLPAPPAVPPVQVTRMNLEDRKTSKPRRFRIGSGSTDGSSPWASSLRGSASSLRESMNSWFGVVRAGKAGVSSDSEEDAAPVSKSPDGGLPEPTAPEPQVIEPVPAGFAPSDHQQHNDASMKTRSLPWVSISVGIGSLNVMIGLMFVVGALLMVKHRALADKEQSSVAEQQQEDISDSQESADSVAALSETANTRARARPSPSPSRRARSQAPRTSPSPRQRSARPTPARTSPARTSPRPPPPTARPSTGPGGGFVVRFRSLGQETRLACGDGQMVEFAGATRRQFQSITTCRVTIDGASTVVQVDGEASITCVPSSGAVRCRRS